MSLMLDMCNAIDKMIVNFPDNTFSDAQINLMGAYFATLCPMMEKLDSKVKSSMVVELYPDKGDIQIKVPYDSKGTWLIVTFTKDGNLKKEHLK